MISMGSSRDRRKVIEQGYSSNKRDMDETELEEGEACSYQDDDDPSIDPDVSLSYIDEKLQNVLGHFKKDFEGLVSTDSLGAKYGAYGSFLPAYRRSPVWPQSRSPLRVHNHQPLLSPSTLMIEGGPCNTLTPAGVPTIKHGSASVGSCSSSAKPPSQLNQCVENAKTLSAKPLEECAPRFDPKTLKVRIKVGSDNKSVKKNAEIYTGLGLDGSPISSFDDNPMERRLSYDSFESPSKILHMMTSSPLHGGCVLSPLSADLLQLSVKPKQDVLGHSAPKVNVETLTESPSCFVKENKPSCKENDVVFLNNKDQRDSFDRQSGFDFLLKESDKDVLSCEELVSNALKLPLLADSSRATDGATAYTGEVGIKGGLDNNLTPNNGLLLNSKHTTKKKVKDFVKERTNKSHKSANGKLSPFGKEKLSSGGKKKTRKGHAHGSVTGKISTESAKEGTEMKQSSFQKNINKVRDTYADFFGDMNDQVSEATGSPDLAVEESLKAPKVLEKAMIPKENTAREMASCLEGNKDVNYERKSSSMSHGGMTSATHFSGASHVSAPENDEWVQCDKCHKWRLLPPGLKTTSLPDKWLCSMLTWLPGMNRCGLTEEETTKAVIDRFHLPPEIPNSLQASLDGPGIHRISGGISNPVVSTNGKRNKTSRSSFQDSSKKRLLAKGRTSVEAQCSNPMNELDSQQQIKSSDNTHLEATQHKKIKKHRHDCLSDGGNSKSLKIKGKREFEEESPRIRKRSKTRSIQRGDYCRETSKDHSNLMSFVDSGNGGTADTVGKDHKTKSDFILSHNVNDLDRHSHDTSERLKGQVETFPVDASMHGTKPDSSNIAVKNRKAGIFKDPAHPTSSSGKSIEDHEKISRKRHRMSRSEGRESSASKRNGKGDKKSETISQHVLDNNESLQKDFSGASVAATSSSSKVSGSFDVKSKFQEPFGSSNFDKLGSGHKGIGEKDIIADAEKLVTGSPMLSAHDDHEGSNGLSCPTRKDALETRTDKKSQQPSMMEGLDKSNGALGHINVDVNSFDPDNGSTAQTLNGCDNESGGNLDGTCVQDKYSTFKSSSGKGKVMSQSYDNLRDDVVVHEKGERDWKIKVEKNFQSNVDKSEKDIVSSQEPSSSKFKGEEEHDENRISSKKFDVRESGHLVSVSLKKKSQSLPPSDGEKFDISNTIQHHQSNGMGTSTTDAHPSNSSKERRGSKKVECQNGTHHVPSKHSMSNGLRIKNQEAPSPLRRDISSQAVSIALKEAKNLKHSADRMKNVDSTESIGLYFEAALKFLHGASLLESGKTENLKQGDVTQAMQIYSDTAELCRFCAHEYEKSKDMANAALAYKCMEVAYLRVVYSSHNAVSRDRCELQTLLQMVPPGESPSSSASDIDNLNNIATGDKTSQARSADSPLIAGNLVIAARNRPNVSRLLKFTEDINSAMEASRKSCTAFAAAHVGIDKADSKDIISSIKRALDFNFHDVEGLLRLVRLAKEATSR